MVIEIPKIFFIAYRKMMILFGNLKLDLNLLFDKLKIFKVKFRLNFTIIFKVVKFENLRMTIQTLSFSNFHL